MITSKQIRASLLLAGLFTLIVGVTSCKRTGPETNKVGSDTNEVWLSAKTNALGSGRIWGSGSLADPFYGDFNAIINSLQTNTTIHLLPGVFHTKGFVWAHGDLALKANQRVIGAGIDVTIIRRDRRWHDDVGQNDGELWSRADGIEVSDLTIDASGSASDRYKNNAIGLYGSHCVVRRVKAINCSGNLARGQESFPFALGNQKGGSVGNILSECRVSSVRGDYFSAVILNGQGIVEKSRVSFPTLTNRNQGLFHAYTVGWSENALFFANFCEGGSFGFYTDTGSLTNLTIMANIFKDVVGGVYIPKSPGKGYGVDGVSITDNRIEFSADAPLDEWNYGIFLANQEAAGKPWRRIRIAGNSIRYADNAANGSRGITAGISIRSTAPENILGIQISGNVVDRRFAFQLEGRDYWLADNVDLEGVPLRVRRLGAGSRRVVVLRATDGSVFVTSTTTATLVLPDAGGFTGREVTIINQRATGDLTVEVLPGNSLLPAGPAMIAPYRTARFISDGSRAWIRE